MDRRVREAAERWLAAARPAVVVEVAEARGSAPRDAGARMLVSADESVGTIGGGHLELTAIAHARELLRAGDTAAHRERFALGPALGQCCGGAVALDYAPLDAAALARWPVAGPRFHLQMHGAGHVGRAIANLLATLDVSVDWIDEREAEFPALTTLGSAWPAHIRRLCVDAVEGEVRLAPPGAFYLVLTHDHELDLRITEAVLRRGDFAYLGLIGSATKRARFVHRFTHRGLDAALIARMTCPIGLGEVVGKDPEVLAVGAVAQLLGRHG
jgi:xanthine dehydrogenase accessory factor